MSRKDSASSEKLTNFQMLTRMPTSKPPPSAEAAISSDPPSVRGWRRTPNVCSNAGIVATFALHCAAARNNFTACTFCMPTLGAVRSCGSRQVKSSKQATPNSLPIASPNASRPSFCNKFTTGAPSPSMTSPACGQQSANGKDLALWPLSWTLGLDAPAIVEVLRLGSPTPTLRFVTPLPLAPPLPPPQRRVSPPPPPPLGAAASADGAGAACSSSAPLGAPSTAPGASAEVMPWRGP
mmetsp:Transcript_85455/g.275052  ORF Transcript_85455/g.275052 Transcript_85455/m.275052 type:complete len:238 (-) Transcript_85455:102-815(-)